MKKDSFPIFYAFLWLCFLVIESFFVIMGLLALKVLPSTTGFTPVQDVFRSVVGVLNLIYVFFVAYGFWCFLKGQRQPLSTLSSMYPFEYRPARNFRGGMGFAFGLFLVGGSVSAVAADINTWADALMMPALMGSLALLCVASTFNQEWLLLRIDHEARVLVRSCSFFFPLQSHFPLEHVKSVDFIFEVFNPGNRQEAMMRKINPKELEVQLLSQFHGSSHPSSFVQEKTFPLSTQDGQELEAWIIRFVLKGTEGEALATFPFNSEDKNIKPFFTHLPKTCTATISIKRIQQVNF